MTDKCFDINSYNNSPLSIYLNELCQLDGVSGNESAVRDYILDKIKPYADDVSVDGLGNIIALKKGAQTPKNKIMLAAHMDEVGMIITDIDKEGLLRFCCVGGIDKRLLPGRSIRINGLPGVIGIKPIHLCDGKSRSAGADTDNLYIDIGAQSDEQAKQYASLGDYASFDTQYELLGDMIKAKAIDDRVGCAIMLDIMSQPLQYDTWFAFTVQEEVGLRGAKTAAYTIDPDIAIVLESTTAADIPGVDGAKCICKVGSGPVISFMDHSTIYDRTLYNTAFALAKESGIACQTKTGIAGGNDSGAIHQSRGGVRTLAISLPCRYIHSPSCMASPVDVMQCGYLAQSCLDRFAQL